VNTIKVVKGPRFRQSVINSKVACGFYWPPEQCIKTSSSYRLHIRNRNADNEFDWDIVNQCWVHG